jgi:hypothetical protein
MWNKHGIGVMTAFLLTFAAVESSSAISQRRAPAPDNWSESKLSLHTANNHRHINETEAACGALAESLDHYRMALAKETDTPLNEFGSGLGGNDEGMQEIRSQFGCTR